MSLVICFVSFHFISFRSSQNVSSLIWYYLYTKIYICVCVGICERKEKEENIVYSISKELLRDGTRLWIMEKFRELIQTSKAISTTIIILLYTLLIADHLYTLTQYFFYERTHSILFRYHFCSHIQIVEFTLT